MTDVAIPRAGEILRRSQISEGDIFLDCISLSYADRLMRRKRLRGVGGASFILDLPQTTSLNHGDALKLETGALIEVQAAPEPLVKITGKDRADLVRLAWHIGNRHTPCQIEEDHLLIAENHVISHMIEALGGHVEAVVQPFNPEGGAYGHGRTFGHDHGHSHD